MPVTTYAWTRDNTTNVTGLENGTGNISGSLINITNIFQVVTFTITPTSTAGCIGDTFTVTVTVNPTTTGSSSFLRNIQYVMM